MRINLNKAKVKTMQGRIEVILRTINYISDHKKTLIKGQESSSINAQNGDNLNLSEIISCQYYYFLNNTKYVIKKIYYNN